MKNRKGFTLVEVLVVIIILGSIMLIVFPTINDTLFASRTAVNKMALKNIKESAEMFAQEVYLCDTTTNILDILKVDLNYPDVNNCKKAKEKLQAGITLSMDTLKKYDYISRADKCSGNIILRLSGEKITNITVDVDNVTCEI